jgi:hypothetical protein
VPTAHIDSGLLDGASEHLTSADPNPASENRSSRAGRKILAPGTGGEFSESNNCKDPSYPLTLGLDSFRPCDGPKNLVNCCNQMVGSPSKLAGTLIGQPEREFRSLDQRVTAIIFGLLSSGLALLAPKDIQSGLVATLIIDPVTRRPLVMQQKPSSRKKTQ